jgi:hypothetical protein
MTGAISQKPLLVNDNPCPTSGGTYKNWLRSPSPEIQSSGGIKSAKQNGYGSLSTWPTCKIELAVNPLTSSISCQSTLLANAMEMTVSPSATV